MNKLLEALKGIERCCDGNNPDHEQIWHIANDAIKEAETEQCDIHIVRESTFDVKPISMELSDELKQHLASIDRANKLAKSFISEIGIPQKYFG